MPKNKIRSQQAKFFDHVMRRKELEHHITCAKIEGTRARGRQREKITDSMARWMEMNRAVEIIREAEDTCTVYETTSGYMWAIK